MKEKLEMIYRPINKDIEAMNGILKKVMTKSRSKDISLMNRYILQNNGKLLRPAMVFLSARAVNNGKKRLSSEKLAKLASGVEMIHLASLVHDDVIDHAHMRHNQPTINIKWGPDVSIALGDYLYSTAFELFADCDIPGVIKCITSALRKISEGELMQICSRGDHGLMKRKYFEIIRKKTAALFSASSQLGAIIAGANKKKEAGMADFGMNFGIAFQIIDDLIDLVGEEHSLGKMPKQDLAVGEFTLPMLHLMDSIPKKDAEKIRQLVLSKRIQTTIEELRSLLESSQSLNKTQGSIVSYIQKAKNSLEQIPNSKYKEVLLTLTDMIYYGRKI